MAHPVSSQAATDLDDIWYHVAKESGSIAVANHLIDSITDRFFLLAGHPYLGRSRDDDFGVGSRSFPLMSTACVYCVEDKDVLILRVAHGRRDIEALFSN
jgi:plasmid stabilization system protein ParE